jgi:hypothetical protein
MYIIIYTFIKLLHMFIFPFFILLIYLLFINKILIYFIRVMSWSIFTYSKVIVFPKYSTIPKYTFILVDDKDELILI